MRKMFGEKKVMQRKNKRWSTERKHSGKPLRRDFAQCVSPQHTTQGYENKLINFA